MRLGRNPDGRGTRLQQERGAIMIMAAVGAVVAVIAAALSIDIGAQALKRRDLQKVADMAAIDAAYGLYDVEGLSILWVELPLYESDAEDRARDSVVRNGVDWDELVSGRVELGWFNDGGDPGAMFDLVSLVLGEPDEREFYPCVEMQDGLLDLGLLDGVLDLLGGAPDYATGCEPNAVRVTLADDVTRYFDIMSSSSPVTQVSAVAKLSSRAEAEPVDPPDDPGDPPPPGGGEGPGGEEYTTVVVGSFLTRLDTTDAPLLTPIFEGMAGAANGSLAGQLIGYDGIASAALTLETLAQALDAMAGIQAGTVNQMLDADITVGELLTAVAAALDSDEGAASAEVSAMGAQFSEAVRAQPVSLGNILRVDLDDPDTPEAGSARINVLHAIVGAVMLANQNNAVSVDLSARAPAYVPANLGDLSLSVTVIEPPQQAVGGVGTTASTGQVRMTVTYRPPASLLSLLTSRPRFRYDVELVGAEAEIVDLCAVDAVVVEARTSYAGGGGGNPVGAIITSLDADGDTLPDSAVLRGLNSGQLEVAVPGNPGETAAFGPDGNFAYGQSWTVWGWPAGVTSPFQSTINNLGLPLLGSTLNNLIGELQGIVDLTANDLAQLTGLMVGGADVTAYEPTCSDPGDPDENDGGTPTTTTVPGDGSGTASADRIPILVK